MKSRRYNLAWSRDPSRSFGAIYPSHRGFNGYHYGHPGGRKRLVQAAKRLLRAGFAAGYVLEIMPDLVGNEHMGCVELVFRK